MKVPIINGDKVGDDSDYYDAIPVNMIAVMRESLGNQGYLYSHDGIDALAVGHGADRGSLYNERIKKHFRVSGQKLIEVSGAVVTVIGDIPGSDLVTMSYSFNSIMIVASGSAYRYADGTLSKITDTDLGSPIDVCWIDNYYFFTDGEYVYHTDITSETSIDPLKFATSEISPDPTKAVGRTQDNLVVVFNRYTTEYFINQANEQFAFSRLNQKAVGVGIVGTHCWCEMDGNIFILGGRKEERPSIHILGAGNAVNIATRSIDKIIAKYNEQALSLVKFECRISERDKLLYIHLPNETLLFNSTIAEKMGINSAWSMLKTGQDEWCAINGIYDPIINKWVYGDKTNNRIGSLNNKIASQYGESVHTEFYSPLIPIETASIDSIEINTISGFSSEDVNMFVSTTRDGVYDSLEWSNEASIKLDYNHRYIVRRLGYCRKNIGLKFRSYNKSKINVSGLEVTYG